MKNDQSIKKQIVEKANGGFTMVYNEFFSFMNPAEAYLLSLLIDLSAISDCRQNKFRISADRIAQKFFVSDRKAIKRHLDNLQNFIDPFTSEPMPLITVHTLTANNCSKEWWIEFHTKNILSLLNNNESENSEDNVVEMPQINNNVGTRYY